MTQEVKCPICGSETVIRTVTKGPNKGLKFHVCVRFPECKGKVPVKEEIVQYGGQRMKLEIEYPNSLSRGILLLKVFFGWIYVGIPHGFMLWLYGIAASFITFIAFWAILFTGKYPKGMFDFVVGYMRWSFRVNAYMNLLTDQYPPFSGNE